MSLHHDRKLFLAYKAFSNVAFRFCMLSTGGINYEERWGRSIETREEVSIQKLPFKFRPYRKNKGWMLDHRLRLFICVLLLVLYCCRWQTPLTPPGAHHGEERRKALRNKFRCPPKCLDHCRHAPEAHRGTQPPSGSHTAGRAATGQSCASCLIGARKRHGEGDINLGG